jgi:hypothetical protein
VRPISLLMARYSRALGYREIVGPPNLTISELAIIWESAHQMTTSAFPSTDLVKLPTSRLLDNFTLSGRNYALRDETASRPVYASLSSSVRYLGASAFTFSMNAA